MAKDFFVDYTKRSFTELLDLADSYLAELVPEWTSRDDNDLNWATIRTICYLGSLANFYIDLGFNEQDPYYMQIYKSALRNAKKYGYTPRKYIGASCSLAITLLAQDDPYTLTTGTAYTYQNLKYIQWGDVVFPTNELTKNVAVYYGDFLSVSLGTSDGEAFQKFIIPTTNILDKKVKVFIDEGTGEEEWEIKETLIMSEETDLHCRLILNEDELYELHFGDNLNGKIPDTSATITVKVIVMLDSYIEDNYGNLPAGNIDSSDNVEIDLIVQTEAATGGGDKESLEEISRNLPQWIATGNRVVSPKDAEFHAKRVAGVLSAKNKNIGGIYNVFITPLGGGEASVVLREEVLAYLVERSMPQLSINVLVPEEEPININVTIVVEDGNFRNTIKALVEDTIEDFLNNLVDVGRLITKMNIYTLMDSIDGLKTATITKLYIDGGVAVLDDIQLDYNKVSVANIVTVIATGGVI